MRKFRVRFLTHKSRSGHEHCESCVRELARFFEVTNHNHKNNKNNNEKRRSNDAEKIIESTINCKHIAKVYDKKTTRIVSIQNMLL